MLSTEQTANHNQYAWNLDQESHLLLVNDHLPIKEAISGMIDQAGNDPDYYQVTVLDYGHVQHLAGQYSNVKIHNNPSMSRATAECNSILNVMQKRLALAAHRCSTKHYNTNHPKIILSISDLQQLFYSAATSEQSIMEQAEELIFILTKLIERGRYVGIHVIVNYSQEKYPVPLLSALSPLFPITLEDQKVHLSR